MADSDAVAARVARLDARVRELEAVQQLILRILSTTKPLDHVLELYGATETQEREFYALLDDLVARVGGREPDRPTFGYFQMQLARVFPALRDDREFTQIVIETLKVERPAYRPLSVYAAEQRWPMWSSHRQP
jgi:hypothetical protein